MYMRLWWKDARQFWSIWVCLGLGAAAAQWVALTYYSPHSRNGVLGAMALAWIGVYAIASGAAAFAGERETGTLRLLDILPAARPVVWAGKVSFALFTTLMLGALLLTMAATGTDRWSTDYLGPEGPLKPWLSVCLGLAVLLALTWALFWSSILKNALTAALAGAGCTAVTLVLVSIWNAVTYGRFTGVGHYDTSYRQYGFAMSELVVSVVILAASNLLFTGSSRRLRLPLQFQSPIVLTPMGPAQPPRQVQIQSPVPSIRSAGMGPRLEAHTVHTAVPDQSPRRSWLAECRALAWETLHQGGPTWGLLAVIGLAIPLPFYLTEGYLDLSTMMLIEIAIALVAGINIFGMENRGRTQRFLTNHGARPGLVWFVKLAVWCVGLFLICGPQAIVAQNIQVVTGPRQETWLQVFLILPLVFAVAVLCGMAIARGLTAAVIALVIMLALAVPQYLLITAHLLPAWGLLMVPVALLVVSWAWSGDWLFDRAAPGRWLRLGTLLAMAFAILFSFYVSFRAWSVPDVGPVAVPRAWIVGRAQPAPDRDLAALYRQAFQAMKGKYPRDAQELGSYQDALKLVRQAAACPDCRSASTGPLTLATPNPFGGGLLENLGALLTMDARDRLAHDDLAGAWNDLIALFRMVRHLSDGAGIKTAVGSLALEREVLDLAMEWTIAPRQTADQLRAALTAIRELPRMTPPDEVLRAESNLTENTIDLPTKELKELLESIVEGPDQARTGFWPAAWIDLLTTPWERTRARRVNRMIASSAIETETLEPAQRAVHRQRSEANVLGNFSSTPLAKILIANQDTLLLNNDLNEVGRQALVQILAIRSWQFKHKGQFPESLEKLVPEELPSLPLDPYSPRAFGYKVSGGERLARLGHVLSGPQDANTISTTGYRILFSSGPGSEIPSRKADAAAPTWMAPYRNVVFPIPPLEGDGRAK